MCEVVQERKEREPKAKPLQVKGTAACYADAVHFQYAFFSGTLAANLSLALTVRRCKCTLVVHLVLRPQTGQ